MLNLHFCVSILHLKRNKEQQIIQRFKFGVGAEGGIQLSVTWFYFSFKIWINILRSNQKVWMHAWIIGSVWVAGSYPAVLGTWSPWTVPDVIRVSLGPAAGTFKFYLFYSILKFSNYCITKVSQLRNLWSITAENDSPVFDGAFHPHSRYLYFNILAVFLCMSNEWGTVACLWISGFMKKICYLFLSVNLSVTDTYSRASAILEATVAWPLWHVTF